MEQQNCPFCAIDKRVIIAKRGNIFVLLSNPRLMEGHVLIVPKKHVQSFSGLAREERNDLFETAVYFQEKLKRLWCGGGCDMSQHDRPFMPTTRLTIPQHLHIHLRPRTWQDEYYEKVLRHETDLFKNISDGEAEKFRALLGE